MYFASFIIYNNINVHIFPLLMSFFSRICCQFDDVSIDAFGQLKFDDKRFWKLLTTPPHLCFFAEFLSLFHSIIQRICSAFRWLWIRFFLDRSCFHLTSNFFEHPVWLLLPTHMMIMMIMIAFWCFKLIINGSS